MRKKWREIKAQRQKGNSKKSNDKEYLINNPLYGKS